MAASSWPEDSTTLLLARRSDHCTVLGPGVRAVLWVQGCPFRCPGCVAPETLPFAGGTTVDVDRLAEELLDLPGIDGVTFSSGEPMAQAAPLAALVDRLRAKRDLSVMSYTGYLFEELRESASPAQRRLLEKLDILIDGPNLAERHTDLRWRGSENQRVYFLTPRHSDWAARVQERGAWQEVESDRDGSVHWMGIPPPGFRRAFEQHLALRGIDLRVRPNPEEKT